MVDTSEIYGTSSDDMKIIGYVFGLEGYFGLEVFTESVNVWHHSGSKVT